MSKLIQSAKLVAAAALTYAHLAAYGQVEAGSPQQSVSSDPDETVERRIPDSGQSLFDTSRSDQGDQAYSDNEAEIGASDGSIYPDSPKPTDDPGVD